MRIVVQRVNSSNVTVDGSVVGSVGRGLLLLVGFGADDTPEVLPAKLAAAAEKVAHLRIFPDDAGRFHLSVLDVGGEILAVPQFTLYADTTKGRRPDFFRALHPEQATHRFDEFVEALRTTGVRNVATGVFGAHMKVALENDGPVTILLEF